ncbi:MAG: DUF1376 domain-containing protein [Candidatus Thiodiazotropha endolucinida]
MSNKKRLGVPNIWWPMYPADFSIDTAHLSNEEIGCYVKLLNGMWRNGGTICSDKRHLSQTVGVSLKKWKKIDESLSPLFTEKDGKWHSDWLSEEWTKAKANSKKKSQNARKRWHGHNETGMQKQCKSNANASDDGMQMQCPSPSPSDTTCISSGTVPDEAHENDENRPANSLGGVA